MHCPNCANESDLDQKFCRKCGFNLEPISKLMAGSPDDDPLKLDKIHRDKLIMERMVRFMIWGMGVMAIGAMILVVNKQFTLAQPIGLLGTLITLAGVGVATYGLLDALRGGALKKREP